MSTQNVPVPDCSLLCRTATAPGVRRYASCFLDPPEHSSLAFELPDGPVARPDATPEPSSRMSIPLATQADCSQAQRASCPPLKFGGAQRAFFYSPSTCANAEILRH